MIADLDDTNRITKSSRGILYLKLRPNETFTRELVQKRHHQNVFVFTENMDGTSGSIPIGNGKYRPTKTTAVIRGLDNAFPITVMKSQGVNFNYDASVLEELTDLWKEEINNIIMSSIDSRRPVIFPFGKIGQGPHSKLPNKFQEILDSFIINLLGIANK